MASRLATAAGGEHTPAPGHEGSSALPNIGINWEWEEHRQPQRSFPGVRIPRWPRAAWPRQHARRYGPRLLEEREASLRLTSALAEGENSGPAEPFDFDAFVARKRAEPADESSPFPDAPCSSGPLKRSGLHGRLLGIGLRSRTYIAGVMRAAIRLEADMKSTKTCDGVREGYSKVIVTHVACSCRPRRLAVRVRQIEG